MSEKSTDAADAPAASRATSVRLLDRHRRSPLGGHAGAATPIHSLDELGADADRAAACRGRRPWLWATGISDRPPQPGLIITGSYSGSPFVAATVRILRRLAKRRDSVGAWLEAHGARMGT